MPLVNVVFFTLAGCAVHLTSVYKSSVVATLLVGSRLLALYHAARVGCDAIGAPESHKRVAYLAYVTQAGVALGLVRTAAARFPRWGDEFGALMVATIVMNQLVGPPMFRAAIVSVGESGVDPGPTANVKAASEPDALDVPVASEA